MERAVPKNNKYPNPAATCCSEVLSATISIVQFPLRLYQEFSGRVSQQQMGTDDISVVPAATSAGYDQSSFKVQNADELRLAQMGMLLPHIPWTLFPVGKGEDKEEKNAMR